MNAPSTTPTAAGVVPSDHRSRRVKTTSKMNEAAPVVKNAVRRIDLLTFSRLGTLGIGLYERQD